MRISTPAYMFTRIRVIGVLEILEGVQHVIIGERGSHLSMDALFWEAKNPRMMKYVKDYYAEKNKG